MVLCSDGESATSFSTPDQINAICQSGVMSSFDSYSVGPDGLLTEADVNTIIESLKRTNVIPSPPVNTANVSDYRNKLNKFIEMIKSEYKFYDVRYKYALSKLLATIADAWNVTTPEKTATINTYLGYTQELNKKINNLITIIKAITTKLYVTSDAMNAQIANFNNTINENRSKLQKQNNIITSSEAVSKLQKEMIKYSEEKGRYTNNLLNLYSFLNIVVFGLLIYVYKASN